MIKPWVHQLRAPFSPCAPALHEHQWTPDFSSWHISEKLLRWSRGDKTQFSCLLGKSPVRDFMQLRGTREFPDQRKSLWCEVETAQRKAFWLLHLGLISLPWLLLQTSPKLSLGVSKTSSSSVHWKCSTAWFCHVGFGLFLLWSCRKQGKPEMCGQGNNF